MRDVRTGHVTEVLFLSPVTLSESIFVTVRFPKYGSRRFGTTNLQSQNATDQRDLFSVSVSTELRATPKSDMATRPNGFMFGGDSNWRGPIWMPHYRTDPLLVARAGPAGESHWPY